MSSTLMDNKKAQTNSGAQPFGPGRSQSSEFGRLISQTIVSEGETFYHHYDALGSTVAITDNTEVVTDEYDYKAFGDTAASTGATPNPFQWVAQVGYRKDETTDLYHLRRRDYNTSSGRFSSEDPVRDDEENLYRYAGSDPVRKTDPSGLFGGPGMSLHMAPAGGGSEPTLESLNRKLNGELLILRDKASQTRGELQDRYGWNYDGPIMQRKLQLITMINVILRSRGGSNSYSGAPAEVIDQITQKKEELRSRTSKIERHLTLAERSKKRRKYHIQSAISERQIIDDISQELYGLDSGFYPQTLLKQRHLDNRYLAAYEGFNKGLKTGGKAVVNGTATAVVNFATLGLNEKQIELIPVTAEDRAAGYDTAVQFATVGGEILIGVITAGAATTLAKGGKLARIGAGVLEIQDSAGNVVGLVKGSMDIAERGELTLGNGLQTGGSLIGLVLNVKTLKDINLGASSTPDVTTGNAGRTIPEDVGSTSAAHSRVDDPDTPRIGNRIEPKNFDDPSSQENIGTIDAPGMPGGRINPGELTDNCVACVAAVLHNKMVGNRTRTFFNSHDMARNYEAVGKHINPVPHEGAVIGYFERHLNLTSTYARLPHVFDDIADTGHYVLISTKHIIYGRVLPNGKRFLYDPQIDEVISWARAQELLGSSRPSIHQIVPEI